MTITLKGVPPSLNEFAGRKNAWQYRSAKDTWTAAAYYAARGSKQRPAKPYQRAEVEITYFFPTRGRHDPDNYSGKFILDGLTRAGVIADDDFRHIRLVLEGDYDKERPRTVIRVKEIS